MSSKIIQFFIFRSLKGSSESMHFPFFKSIPPAKLPCLLTSVFSFPSRSRPLCSTVPCFFLCQLPLLGLKSFNHQALLLSWCVSSDRLSYNAPLSLVGINACLPRVALLFFLRLLTTVWRKMRPWRRNRSVTEYLQRYVRFCRLSSLCRSLQTRDNPQVYLMSRA